jgi:hypothetical protein
LLIEFSESAFGTFLGVPDPSQFMGDAGFLKTRFKADPSAGFHAENTGDVVGSNVVTNWGRVGFLARSPFGQICGARGYRSS